MLGEGPILRSWNFMCNLLMASLLKLAYYMHACTCAPWLICVIGIHNASCHCQFPKEHGSYMYGAQWWLVEVIATCVKLHKAHLLGLVPNRGGGGHPSAHSGTPI